jgi:hypothetical protein
MQLCVEVFAPKVPGRIAQGIALGTMAYDASQHAESVRQVHSMESLRVTE